MAKVQGIAQGKQEWVTVSPDSVGWKGETQASSAITITALADPRYYTEGIGWSGKETKTHEPKVEELSENNNELTVNRSDIKPWP